MARLLAVAGAAPGVGKSTLCTALRDHYAAQHLRVDHFREEEILTRPAFAVVAAEFADTGTVAPDTLLTATGTYARDLTTDDVDVIVTDALVPYIPSLVAWGHDEAQINRFLHRLQPLVADLHPTLIYLDGDPEVALSRAAQREGDGWLTWFIDKLAGYDVQPPVTDAASACAYLTHERDVTLRLIAGLPWHLIIIDNAHGRPPDQIGSEVIAALTNTESPR